MANPDHLGQLNDGVDAWNRWRNESPEIRPDLSEANLHRSNLRKADFSKVNLSGANLSDADLSEASLSEAKLIEANLSKANLSGANLREANLRGANLGDANFFVATLSNAELSEANLLGADLREADLREANLNWANLSGVDLSGANLSEADLSGARFIKTLIGFTAFANVDLSEVQGLDTVIHRGPSTIGLDTIYKSKGKILHAFLRDCGVPENFIEDMASLVGTGIEFYSLFISYSTHDEEFANRLHADLQVNGVRCWFAPDQMQAGKKIHRLIDEAIRAYDRLLLVLSPASMASDWVRTEIKYARQKEKEQGKDVLFPIGLCPFSEIRKWEYFDADIGKSSASEIREYHIPDFSNWKDHDEYKIAFDRLLADLKGKS